MTVESGPPINVWATCRTASLAADFQATLAIPLNDHVVIGRQKGGEVPYLDPRFVPTPIVPESGQTILRADGHDAADTWVSRGHFMLHSRDGALVLVNGVPRRGGGIRSPINGTIMLYPSRRWMRPEEEFVIRPGKMARIQLPNGTVIAIRADSRRR
jgi:hypothetical protein